MGAQYAAMKTKNIPMVTAAIASLIPLAAVAQNTNPFQAAKDAYDKAKQELQQAQSQATAPPQQPAPAQPTAAAPLSANAYYTLCRYQGQLDGHPIAYVTPIIHTDRGASDISTAFNKYMSATYDINKIQYGSGYCRTVSNSPDQQAYTLSQIEKQWADSKTTVTHINWTGTPAEIEATNAHLAASASAAAASSAGGPFISCSTSATPGVDTYFTGIFQTTRPIKRLPNGAKIVDQSVLDHFSAYLTQKGYKFKPGNNQSCDVSPTEAATAAAQHTRAYGGGGGLGVNCCGNGKVVETGWKDTP